MFLSRLVIDAGGNPDRPRPGRLWLRNLYHVHQRLCMAFPSPARKSEDPEYLKPFKPEDFGNGQVHVKRDGDSGFLFRIDPHHNGRAELIVQSAVEPEWEYAFHNAGYLLAAPPEVKLYNPAFAKGQRLRFSLVANPTKKIDTIKKEERRNCTKEELKEKRGRHGKRVPVPSREEIEAWRRQNPNKDVRRFIGSRLMDWLDRWRPEANKGSGFSINSDTTNVQPGYVHVQKQRDSDGQRLRSVRYEGVLEVTDADIFHNTLVRGIGPGKAFGFGLLSVAPLPAGAK